jgi:hypothetical protein
MLSAVLAFTLWFTPPPPPIYYVSASGSDTNDGLSTSAPWATLNCFATNATRFPSGTTVRLKRGDEWRASEPLFVKGATNLTIGAYGTGAAPLIYGGTNFTATWTNVAGTTWGTVPATNGFTEVYCLYTNEVPVIDARLYTASSRLPFVSTNVGTFVWDGTNLYANLGALTAPTNLMASMGNPTASVDVRGGAVTFYYCSNVVLDGIKVRNSCWWNGYYGVYVGWSWDVTVMNSEVQWASKHHMGDINAGPVRWLTNTIRDNMTISSSAVSYGDLAWGGVHEWRGNYFTNIGFALYSHFVGSGLGTNNGGALVFSSNTVLDAICGSSEQLDIPVQITDNILVNCDLAVASARGAYVARNRMSHGTISMFLSQSRTNDLIVENNIMTNSAGGMLISSGAAPLARAFVQGNTIIGTNNGVGNAWSYGAPANTLFVRGNLFVFPAPVAMTGTNYGTWTRNVYSKTVTNGTLPINGMSLNGTTVVWSGWVATVGTTDTNNLGVVAGITNGHVPATDSTAADRIPWLTALSWGLTNDINGPRTEGNAVTAGAVEVTP